MKLTVIIFLTLIVGFTSGYIFSNKRNLSDAHEWIELGLSSHKGYSWTSKALLESDIQIPEIKALSGKVKFLDSIENGSDELVLGYIVSVDIDSLDLEAVPAKYKQEIQWDNGWTTEPIKEVTYQVRFEFILKDSDGFFLSTVSGSDQFVTSGKINMIQGKVVDEVSLSLSKRVSEITFTMQFLKCETCKLESP